LGQPCSVEPVVICLAGLHYLADLTVLWFLAPDLQRMLPEAPLRINAAQIVGLECRARWAKGSAAFLAACG